jgi:hypothetical protein
MSIGLSISPLGTYAIASDEHIAMALCSLVSLLSLKVSVYFLALLLFLTHECHLANHSNRDDATFRKFRCQLLHSSLVKMLKSLRPGMTVPEVVCFPDGHYRKVVYGLSPYISDYPEQALLVCIVQGWCAKYVSFYLTRCTLTCLFQVRCIAPASDLDSGLYLCHSQQHTELMVEEFELGKLWDSYGMVGDVVVHISSCLQLSS